MRPPTWAQEYDPRDLAPEPPDPGEDPADNMDGRFDPEPPDPRDEECFVPAGVGDPDAEVF